MLIPIFSTYIVYIFKKKNNMELYSYPDMKSLFTAFIYFNIFKSEHRKNIFYAYFFYPITIINLI